MTKYHFKSRQLRKAPPMAQTTVEFALILWPFIMLLFATCDYAQVYFYESSLRYALSEAGRFATLGNILTTNMYSSGGVVTNTGPMRSSYSTGIISRNESIRNWYQSNTVVAVGKSSIVIESWPGGPTGTYTEANPAKGPGYANDNVQISVTYPIQLITPVAALLFSNGIYHLTVTSIFLNEPSKVFNTYTNVYPNEP